ncbi:unnamed protein product [Caenorhabditis angaria]|uniref:Uncharacterized protein n=1 Tax=Caenorhabditis angaria TaxID=860376 RepID=A0A9P1IC19_9PELO|nr:unnamed protein product [Caenorhabditis angaria]
MSSFSENIPFLQSNETRIVFNIPLLSDYRRIEHPITKLLLSIELIMAPCSIIFFTWFVYCLIGFATIHRNLKVILLFQTLHFWAGNIARIYFILIQFSFIDIQPNFLLFICSFSRFQHYSIGACTSIVLGLERVFATIFVTKYEQQKNLWVSSVCIFYLIIHSQILAIPMIFSNISRIFFIVFTGFTTISALAIFFVLHRVNQKNLQKLNRILKNSQSDPNVVYSLSRKFQLEENIRVLDLYRNVGVALNTLNISFIILSNIAFLLFQPKNSSKRPVNALLSLLFTSIGVILPIGGIIFFRGSSIFCRRKQNEQEENYRIQYYSGSSYFAQLQNSWEVRN